MADRPSRQVSLPPRWSLHSPDSAIVCHSKQNDPAREVGQRYNFLGKVVVLNPIGLNSTPEPSPLRMISSNSALVIQPLLLSSHQNLVLSDYDSADVPHKQLAERI